ncbi:beta-1,3-galactosyltransferase 5 [Culicoides brevitarsis]|uniref:beta-1,3-galactosyltransferase 5 n=1 Tax=Culicoides brevitarsis TaxID=469753 RepID=UPI00307B1509
MRILVRRSVIYLIVFLISCLLIRAIQLRNSSNHLQSIEIEISEDVKLNQKRLIDLKDEFHYILKPNLNFYEVKTRFLGIIIIHSYVGHDHLRAKHREAISSKELLAFGLKRVFLLSEIPPKERYMTQRALNNEANRFQDILQGNFIDAYRNLTYKHVMGLRFAVTEARDAQFIIKMDDDIVVDFFRIHEMLKNLDQNEQEYFLKGFVLSDQHVRREKQNKWYVTRDEFAASTYPSYLSGWFYITNIKTAHDLALASESTPYFWIDDIYVTGILAEELSIDREAMNELISSNSEFIDCCLKDMTNKKLQCSYLIGPNGGDSNLITSFMKAAKKCFLNGCQARDERHHVRHTCVAQVKNLLGDRGEPHIQAVRL